MQAKTIWDQKRLSLPKEAVLPLQLGRGGWVAGSTADPTRLPPHSDLDLFVAHEDWHEVSIYLATLPFIKLTRFGGISVRTGESGAMDVWPDTLERLVIQHPTSHFWHPRSDVYIRARRLRA